MARSTFGSPPGGVWDHLGNQWWIVDVDGTRAAARQRALPHTADLPAPHRRFDQVCASGYLGRKRGEVVRTRTTILQAHTHQCLGTFGGAGNGDYRGELLRARAVISSYATSLSLPVSHVLVRLDGLYGDAAPLADLLTPGGVGVVVRGKNYDLLDLPVVQARLQLPPDQQTMHPESGTCRTLYDCLDVPLSPTGPVVRLILATHPASSSPPSIGTTRNGIVYEQFFTTVPPHAFTPADVLDLYLHRGSFETVLADEDQEQDPDRWCSRTPWGQEFWQIVSQWLWNLRLEFGQQAFPTTMRLTEFAYSQVSESAPVAGPAPVSEPVIYGPPQWARQSYTKGFAGADFSLQPDGTLRCPANSPLYAQERRLERDGSLRVLYAARIGHCRSCPLRSQCQENATTTVKPRRVSAVFWPVQTSSSNRSQVLVASPPSPPVALLPILWGDWPRCQIRRTFLTLLRTQTVVVTPGFVQPEETKDTMGQDVQNRAQRAHWRLSWKQRLAHNARPATAPPLEITIHGLPVAFARSFGFALLTAASAKILLLDDFLGGLLPGDGFSSMFVYFPPPFPFHSSFSLDRAYLPKTV